MSPADHTAEQERITAADKRIATARARVALIGGALHVLENDRGRPVFIVSRWCFTKELPTIEEVEAGIERVAPTRS